MFGIAIIIREQPGSRKLEYILMPIVVGVSLRTAGKIYYFDPGMDRYDARSGVL